MGLAMVKHGFLVGGICWCVLMTALLAPGAVQARLNLGLTQSQAEILGGPEALERLGAAYSQGLDEEVVIRVFPDKADLFEWMERFRVVEVGLVSLSRARDLPVGQFHDLALWEEMDVVFLSRQGTSSQRRALLRDLTKGFLQPDPVTVESPRPVREAPPVERDIPRPIQDIPQPVQEIPQPVPLAPPSPAHQRGIEMAREGHHAQALEILADLYVATPADPGLAYDYLTVLTWAGLDVEALIVAEPLDLDQAPLYVVEAVAKALRNEQRFDEAADTYAQALQRFPEEFDLGAGLAYTLAEAGRAAEAADQVAHLRRRYPQDARPLEVGIYVAQVSDDHAEALDLSQRLLDRDPRHEGALRARILALHGLGASHLAKELAIRDPQVVSREFHWRLQADRAAHEVRWGDFEPPTEPLRFARTDQALVAIETNLSALDPEDPAARPFILLGRFDRIVALRDRVLMREAVDEYESLLAEGVEIPDFVWAAAGDAYLYLEQPEEARDLYLQVLEADPGDFATQQALFYAYVELNDFAAARTLADALQAERSPWLNPGGSNLSAPNVERLDADVLAGLARLYARDLVEAQERFEAMHAVAPRNPGLVRELGNVQGARGWPRRAQRTYKDGLAIKPDHLGLGMGMASTHLGLHEFDLAGDEIADLDRRFPENRQVQSLKRLWDVHQMRELRASAAFSDSSATGPNERELRLRSTLFSAPFLTHYRLFVEGFWSRGNFPEGRGTYQRYGGGLEYRGRDWQGTAALSFNHSDGSDLGLALAATWQPDDHWSVPLSLEKFSADTPLRALRNGVHADALGLGADYRWSELRRMGLHGRFMDFSDGNQRAILSGYLRQRLHTRPMYTLDGVVDLSTSTNKRSDVPYFSPDHDLSAVLTLDNDWQLYRRYSRAFGHRLAVSGGAYWQQDFGTRPVASLLYEHYWQTAERFYLVYGGALSRWAYDGRGETGSEYFIRLNWRL
ncbi:poly-beta-1,6 N-acetyl-D-glucosamine export porin PgaA [Geoalkalibacter halelectricus]|nr:poly-beta-1,6 N-acetyl-D-glucosamine export porin PgaA [Geoalkalibacter halelectricus]